MASDLLMCAIRALSQESCGDLPDRRRPRIAGRCSRFGGRSGLRVVSGPLDVTLTDQVSGHAVDVDAVC